MNFIALSVKMIIVINIAYIKGLHKQNQYHSFIRISFQEVKNMIKIYQ